MRITSSFGYQIYKKFQKLVSKEFTFDFNLTQASLLTPFVDEIHGVGRGGLREVSEEFQSYVMED